MSEQLEARLIGVGLGPGNPDLVTIGAVKALREADLVFAPVSTTTSGVGYAERIIAVHAPAATIVPVEFALQEPERSLSWKRAAELIAEKLCDGGTAVFATIGDPNIFSTFTYMAEEIKANYPTIILETIPGISAAQALSAASGLVLTTHDVPLTIIPATAGMDTVTDTLKTNATVVIYKGGSQLQAIREVVERLRPGAKVAFGSRLGLPEQEIIDGFPSTKTEYLSTVVIQSESVEQA